MWETGKFPKPQQLGSWAEEMKTMGDHIREEAETKGALNILEAGCGAQLNLDLGGVQVQINGRGY